MEEAGNPPHNLGALALVGHALILLMICAGIYLCRFTTLLR